MIKIRSVVKVVNVEQNVTVTVNVVRRVVVKLTRNVNVEKNVVIVKIEVVNVIVFVVRLV